MSDSALSDLVRDIPDFPIPGINFKDITTLIGNGPAFRSAIDLLTARYIGREIDAIMGIESRGFIFSAPVAYRLGVGLIPVRKPGKLPSATYQVAYDLEYGQDSLEMHKDAVGDGHRILIVDDLLATGGTAKAVVDLVESVGGKIEGLLFVVELDFLKGREKFNGYTVQSLVNYSS